MISLAFESSCDDFSIAIVDEKKGILGQVIKNQTSHNKYGGVIPEIAAREHLELLTPSLEEVFSQTKLPKEKIDLIAATSGPGLTGSLMVGLAAAKTVSIFIQRPFIAVNHLEGHALTIGLTDKIYPPYLLLLISGGHSLLAVINDIEEYTILGKTLDDSIGEAFDKVSRMMGFGFPGGKIIEKLALDGNEDRFKLPIPLKKKSCLNFSFSGIKTAVANLIRKQQNLSEQDKYDISASFQKSIFSSLLFKIKKYMKKESSLKVKQLVISGGVASNLYLRKKIQELCKTTGWDFKVPPKFLCTDNAAMIGWAAIQKFKKRKRNDITEDIKPSWRLEECL